MWLCTGKHAHTYIDKYIQYSYVNIYPHTYTYAYTSKYVDHTPTIYPLSLSLSLSHTHTHTHTEREYISGSREVSLAIIGIPNCGLLAQSGFVVHSREAKVIMDTATLSGWTKVMPGTFFVLCYERWHMIPWWSPSCVSFDSLSIYCFGQNENMDIHLNHVQYFIDSQPFYWSSSFVFKWPRDMSRVWIPSSPDEEVLLGDLQWRMPDSTP
jgi:hypothetical protein